MAAVSRLSGCCELEEKQAVVCAQDIQACGLAYDSVIASVAPRYRRSDAGPVAFFVYRNQQVNSTSELLLIRGKLQKERAR